MKKAQELSVLCDMKINVSFYDSEINKVVEFATDPEISLIKMAQRAVGIGKSPFQPWQTCKKSNLNSKKLGTFKFKLIKGE